MVSANDTDFLVIAFATLSQLQGLGIQELWQGRNLKWIPVHELTSPLTSERRQVICSSSTPLQDVTLYLNSADMATSQPGRHVMCALKLQVSSRNWTVILQTLKKMTLWCWRSLSSQCMTDPAVDDAWLELFARKQRSYQAIPPTQAALVQHIRCAAYQVALMWQPEVETPAEWVWKREGDCWSIILSALPPVAQSLLQLTKCLCKMQCRGWCKCYKYNHVQLLRIVFIWNPGTTPSYL